MPTKKTTMREIARAVGTSAVTVSKAMAGKSGMSDRLRTKILRKAKEMGYQYPQSGRRILPEHMNIGILIPERYFWIFTMSRPMLTQWRETTHMDPTDLQAT